jgi:hypothetical protein
MSFVAFLPSSAEITIWGQYKFCHPRTLIGRALGFFCVV